MWCYKVMHLYLEVKHPYTRIEYRAFICWHDASMCTRRICHEPQLQQQEVRHELHRKVAAAAQQPGQAATTQARKLVWQDSFIRDMTRLHWYGSSYTHCNTYCNTHCNTYCNTHCNTHTRYIARGMTLYVIRLFVFDTTHSYLTWLFIFDMAHVTYVTNLKKRIRAHRASSKATMLFLTK